MRKKKNTLNNRGQLSIFFGMTLTLLITTIAFISNVGLIVKAKINLQNAVDAAAWSGAAVQSRYLSSIAYANWEMRNTYKEWMFKYYVLGQLANEKTTLPSGGASSFTGQRMDFRLKRLEATENLFDRWNIPSICIKLSGERGNLCGIFTQPGLPRYGTQGAVTLDESYNRAVNEFVKVKSDNCIRRSVFNQQVALIWAYGTGLANYDFFDRTPQIAAQRTGAWTEAFELALRVRNLEFLVNQPPQTSVCASGGDCTQVDDLFQSGGDVPLNERTVKAFWAAYRNLGNSDSRGPSEVKANFRLTEIEPGLNVTSSPNSLSNLLIPSVYPKYYLDLRINIANFVTFFSSFIPRTRSDSAAGGSGIPGQANCALAKTALPVPGYFLGFSKNPSILTYYAVKGETAYNGLFNPFQRPITLTAYAAAKPYGGRIGPHLLRFDPTGQSTLPRGQRSFPYLTAVNRNSAAVGYTLGEPVPSSSDFYVENNDNSVVGGVPQTPTTPVRFSIPNLIYDVPEDANNLQAQDGGTLRLQPVIANNTAPGPGSGVGGSTPEFAGLYGADQFKMLKDNLVFSSANIVNAQEVDDAIVRLRKPTRYDVLNYMIPTFNRSGNEVEDNSVIQEAANPVTTSTAPGTNRRQYQLYAPLFEPGLLYNSATDIEVVLNQYIANNQFAVDNYNRAMNEVANFARTQDASSAQGLYQRAADSLHNNPGSPLSPSCPSLAGQFTYFFSGQGQGSGTSCVQTLGTVIIDALQQKIAGFPGYARYINPTVPSEADLTEVNSKYKSGYAPGPRHGALTNAVIPHPFFATRQRFDAHRNFYSTKFVAVQSLFNNSPRSYFSGDFSIYSEGIYTTPVDLQSDSSYQVFGNAIDPAQFEELDPDGRGLTH